MRKILFCLYLSLQLSGIYAQHTINTIIPDSLISIENVYVYCLTEPQKAQQMLDSIRERNDTKLAFDYEMDWAQADLYYNQGKYRSAIRYFELVEKHDTIRNNSYFRMSLLSTMMECYRLNNDFDKTMECALKLLDIAQEKGNKAEAGRAYLFMGKVLFRKGNKEKADEYFKRAEQQLRASGDILYLYHFYLTLANLQDENGLYPQALETARLCENVLKEMEDIEGMPEKYVECEQNRFDALMADILAKNKKKEEADMYYKRFISSDFASDSENRIHIVPYLLTIQYYKKAIEISREREAYLKQHTDTIGDNMLVVKQYLATAYQRIGNMNKAFSYSQEQLAITDSLRAREQQQAGVELAFIYETQEKDAQIQHQKADIKIRSILLMSVSIISILLIVLFVVSVVNTRKTSLKNRLLVQQIRNAQKAKQEKEPDEAGNKKQDVPDLASHTDKQANDQHNLYLRLHHLMVDKKMYRDAQLTRDSLAATLHTNKNMLIAVVQENTGLGVNDYINAIRLNEALQLLDKTDVNKTIESIGEQVGLSKSSFYRLFKQKYGMSPAEYRKVILKENILTAV